MHDLIIRDALIFDGLGGAPIRGDLAVDGDTIATVGSVTGPARETVDAGGLALAPGFIDTDLTHDFLHSDAGKRLEARIPLRRLGRPDDLDGALFPHQAHQASANRTNTILDHANLLFHRSPPPNRKVP